ncbi:hypothetical protein [Mesorhizobium sp. WSM3224]|uniref:hypothetical protein n=1 Tax=Mesorhizobium sp. WSM3224 TaxID=1040986 RepID=UPI000481D720|nr:hypothetical protein [Mesorhizobium sp. WSM3224]
MIRVAFLIFLLLSAHSEAKACFDLSQKQPERLSGMLTYRIFAGPPNFEDVATGDAPEPAYILQLDSPICLTGDELASADRSFSTVQLLPIVGTGGLMRALVGKRVEADLSEPYAGVTGHHHAPLLATVVRIYRDHDTAREFGTPATTIRAFYYALGQGSGDEASKYVVPEKRRSGPLSASATTAFYGSLDEPLRLLGIEPRGESSFVAHYTFKRGARSCDGRSVVQTVKRDGRNLISSIRALDGC